MVNTERFQCVVTAYLVTTKATDMLYNPVNCASLVMQGQILLAFPVPECEDIEPVVDAHDNDWSTHLHRVCNDASRIYGSKHGDVAGWCDSYQNTCSPDRRYSSPGSLLGLLY